MMNYLSRETKMDALSSLLVAGGIVLALTASELASPVLLGAGVALVTGTAIARVIHVRGESAASRRSTKDKRELAHTGTRG
jgi:hypothetical protein